MTVEEEKSLTVYEREYLKEITKIRMTLEDISKLWEKMAGD